MLSHQNLKSFLIKLVKIIKVVYCGDSILYVLNRLSIVILPIKNMMVRKGYIFPVGMLSGHFCGEHTGETIVNGSRL